MSVSRNQWLWIECLLLYVALPTAFTFVKHKSIVFVALWIMALICVHYWKKRTGLTLLSQVRLRAIQRKDWIRMLGRWALASVLLIGFLAVINPTRLFEFVTTKPALWAMVMVLYPLLSVFPQEVIYRLFFFERYAPIFKAEWQMLLMSGLAFGHGHVVFNNFVAYCLSIVGGMIFAHTYSRHRSFGMVWVEHAIYGCWVFTVGLGWYFYTGAAHMHHWQTVSITP